MFLLLYVCYNIASFVLLYSVICLSSSVLTNGEENFALISCTVLAALVLYRQRSTFLCCC